MSAHHFFVTSPIFRDEPTFADQSWLWAAITIVLIICTRKWPTYIRKAESVLFLVVLPLKNFLHKNVEERGLYQKTPFFGHFSCPSKEKNCYSDNFDASGLPHGSFESLWAKFKWEHWKSGNFFQNWGPSPLWSQPIQDRVPQKSCF